MICVYLAHSLNVFHESDLCLSGQYDVRWVGHTPLRLGTFLGGALVVILNLLVPVKSSGGNRNMITCIGAQESLGVIKINACGQYYYLDMDLSSTGCTRLCPVS